jgi:hypothetical protein
VVKHGRGPETEGEVSSVLCGEPLVLPEVAAFAEVVARLRTLCAFYPEHITVVAERARAQLLAPAIAHWARPV